MFDVGAMRLSRPDANTKRDGYFLIAPSFCQQLNDLPLADGYAAVRPNLFRRSSVIQVLTKDKIRDSRRQERLVLEQRFHSGDEIDIGIGLEHVTSGANVQHFA